MTTKLSKEDELDILKEIGLDPQQWRIVDTPPIIPGQNPPPLLGEDEVSLRYPAHNLPNHMLSTRAQATKPQSGIPVRALWPVQAPGKANANAAIVSQVGPVKKSASAAQAAATALGNTPVVSVNSNGNMQQGSLNKLPVAPKPVSPVSQDNLPDSSTYGRVLQTALTANQIDPSKSGVLMRGSVPTILSGAFTYTATTTSITISWNSLTLYRADGTTTAIGSGSQTITGLTAGTTYYFYPYWDEVGGAVGFVQSSSLSNSVTPIVGANMTAASGYVSTATSLTLPTSVSVETWFHMLGDTDLVQFATPQTGGVTTEVMGLGTSSGKITWTPGTSSIQSSLTYEDGQWHHVVGTYDGTTAKLYVDGVQVASGAVSAHTSFSGWWRPCGVAFGATKTKAHTAIYTGTILSAAQVANHYTAMRNGGVATYSAGVLADGATYYWKLIETAGTTAADSAGTNTGTYQGTVTLNQSQGIVSSTGSPAYAWNGPLIQAQQAQALQSHAPLSAGTLQAATPAAGTAGGISGGATGPGGGGSKGLQ